jgi:hypothetical protein
LTATSEAFARVKIDRALEASGWDLLDGERGIRFENRVIPRQPILSQFVPLWT